MYVRFKETNVLQNILNKYTKDMKIEGEFMFLIHSVSNFQIFGNFEHSKRSSEVS